MKSKRVISLALLFGIIFSTPSSALDIPLLTWEQGKSQSVVLGGPTAANNWQVSLVSASGTKARFRSSALNNSGFRVYTIDLSSRLTSGRYTVETQGPGSPQTVVSEVLIVPAKKYEVPRAPFDLLFIFGFLAVFVSALISMRRSRTFVSSFPNRIADVEKLITGQDLINIKRFRVNSLEVKRVKFVTGLPDSFLKILLLADSNFAFTLPLRGFVILPVVSLILGSLLFITHENAAHFSTLSTVLLILLLVVSHLDLLSGIFGAITFLALYVALSGSLDVRNGFAALVLTGVFIFPAIFSLMGRWTSTELRKSTRVAYLILSIFGSFYIPCAYLVVKSLSPDQELSSTGVPYLIAAAFFSLAIKHELVLRFLDREVQDQAEINAQIPIARLFSSGSIVTLFITLIVLFMNWTENLATSLLAAFAWTVPFLLSSIRLDGVVIRIFAKIPRIIWLEIALVLGSVIAIFFASRNLPYLVQDLSALLLILLAIPSIVHALFVLLVTSHKDQEVSA